MQKLCSATLKGVLEVTKHTDNEIISDIFLRDKKDGSHRMILNLKKLNLHTTKAHFKMDTLHTITKLIVKDCFMASIDLKDAYYSVPITRKDRKYLRSFGKVTFCSSHAYQMASPVHRENSLNF